MHVSPRLLIVKCASKEYGFFICSGHAPCRSDHDAAVAWWKALHPVMRKDIPEGATVLFGIDMNATPASEADDVFGQSFCGRKYNTTDAMAEAMRALDLWAPGTF